MAFSDTLFARIDEEEERRRRLRQRQTLSERRDPGLFEFSGLKDAFLGDLPPATTPAGTLFDVRTQPGDSPIKALASSGAEFVETMLGPERLFLTDLDVDHPNINTLTNAASMLAQGVGAVASLPTAAKSIIPVARGGAKALANLASLGERGARPLSRVAAKGTLGGTFGAQAHLRSQGVEDPAGVVTAALAGAGGGQFAPSIGGVAAGVPFDVASGLTEVARTNPEALGRAFSEAPTEEMRDQRSEARRQVLAQLGYETVTPVLGQVASAAVRPSARAIEAQILDEARTTPFEPEPGTRAAEQEIRDEMAIDEARRISEQATEQEFAERLAQGETIARDPGRRELPFYPSEEQRRAGEGFVRLQGEPLPGSEVRGLPPSQFDAEMQAAASTLRHRLKARESTERAPEAADVAPELARVDMEAETSRALEQLPERVAIDEEFREAISDAYDRMETYKTAEDAAADIAQEVQRYSLGDIQDRMDQSPEKYVSEYFERVLGIGAAGTEQARRLEIDQNLETAGRVDVDPDGTVVIRLNPKAANVEGVMREEGFHAFEKSDIMTPRMLDLIDEYVNRPENLQRLEDAIRNDPTQSEEGIARQLAQLDDQSERRAKAYAYSDQLRARAAEPATGIGTTALRMLDHIKEFWRRTKNLFSGKGFQTGADLLRSFDEGSFSDRPPEPDLFRRITRTDAPIRSNTVQDVVNEALAWRNAVANRADVAGVSRAIPGTMRLLGRILPQDWSEGQGFARQGTAKAGRKQGAQMFNARVADALRKGLDGLDTPQKQEIFEFLRGDLPTQENGAPIFRFIDPSKNQSVVDAAIEARREIDTMSRTALEEIRTVDPNRENDRLQGLATAIEQNLNSYLARLYEADYDNKHLHRQFRSYKKTAEKVLKRPLGTGARFNETSDEFGQLEAYFQPLREKAGYDADANEYTKAKSLTKDERGALYWQDAVRLMLEQREGPKPRSFDDLFNAAMTYATARELDASTAAGLKSLTSGGPPVAKAKNRLKRRTDIPVEFRRLLGELADSPLQVYETMNHLSSLSNQIEYVRSMMREKRIDGQPLFKDERDAASGHIHEVTGDTFDPITKAFVSGKYVDADTREALGDVRYLGGIGGAMGRLAEALRQYTMVWQRSQTAYSLQTHQLNLTGNAVLYAFIDGVTPANPLNWKYYKRAWRALDDSTSADYKLFAENAAARQFLEPEVESRLREMLRKEREANPDANPLSVMKAVNKAFHKTLGGARTGASRLNRKIISAYIWEDQIFRAASFFRHLEKTGSIQRAAELTNRHFPDYSRVPQVIQALQRTPFAAPFLSFAFEQPRLMLNAVMDAPFRSALVFTSLAALTKGASVLGSLYGMEGLSDKDLEDWEYIQEIARKPYQRGHNLWPQMTTSDGGKRMLAFSDADAWTPWASTLQLAGTFRKEGPVGGFSRFMDDTIFAGPVANALTLLRTGADDSGFQRIPEDASYTERAAIIASSMGRSIIPPELGTYGVDIPGEDVLKDIAGYLGVEDLQLGHRAAMYERALSGSPDRYGRIEQKGLARIRAASGVNFRPFYPDADFNQSVGRNRRGLVDRVARAESVIEAPNSRPEDVQRAIDALEKDIQESVEKYKRQQEGLRRGLKITTMRTGRARDNISEARRQYKAAVTRARNAMRKGRSRISRVAPPAQ